MSDPNGIVISGISGVFPNSENVEEFKENLLAGNDMISMSTRSHEGIKFGQIKTIDRFDNSFFRITHNQANSMTIASRLLLEKTFEAILDAGYNPEEIKGKNIAVIGGMWECTDGGDPTWDKKPDDYTEVFGRLMFMVTNRISYWLDVHGPSYPVNTACSSALYAIDHAVKAIQKGQCEGAIICSANFCFPQGILLENSPVLSAEGKSAPFDIDGNGYVRAETVCVLFLQKRQHARRIYANIIHSTTNSDGFKKEGIASPSVTQQIQLYKQFYEEIDMDPRKISYIEAHGTGTQAGDIAEGTALDKFFCANRTTPLKIGSVKSNMGHAEAASALSSVAKMIISFETGIIPANIRYNRPNPKIDGLLSGRLEVVSKHTPLEGEYFALNSFGIGGSNGHMVLSPHTKVQNEGNSSQNGLPRIVTASGRTEEAVDCIFSNHYAGEKRPIWFVFSGIGSQWPAMGKSLMKIPIFAESIQRSQQVLQPKGLDLIKIITDEDPKIFDNILNSFVGIAAIQLALLEVLKKLNIKPDGIVGHSVGELGCAYADECFTAEQMLLAAYYRGLVTLKSGLVHGTMAAVGLSYESMKDLVPPEIDIACHNGPSSCTISGPTQIMQDFIKNLNQKKIFVRAVDSSNIAFHSRYIASAGPKFASYLKTIIPEPKLRSHKWICTSAPEHEWESDKVRYSSIEYYTNNLLNPVYFEESYSHIPNNAITIEIAPHGQLNSILKYALPKTVDNIPLTMRNHENNVEYLFNAFGRLYEIGCDMELCHLYPPVEFPVSKSTPMIAPIIKWQHDEQWVIDEFHTEGIFQSCERKIICDPKKDGEYLRGHIIDGRNLYPGVGYLWLVVETLAMMGNKKVTEVSVVFENVYFEHALVIPEKDKINFCVSIHELNNYFQIKANRTVVATGKVRVLERDQKEMIDVVPYKDEISNSDTLLMRKNDFYKELRLRGYYYEGLFKNVEYIDCDGKYGEISWNNNFVPFMDALTQITLLHFDCRDLRILTFFQKVVIDFEKHFEILETLDKENPKFPANYYPDYGIFCAGGIQISGWKTIEISRQKSRAEPSHQKHRYGI